MDLGIVLLVSYVIGMFLFFIGVCVYAQYQYQYGTGYRMIMERVDVVFACILGIIASPFWPALAVVMLGIWLARRILKFLVANGPRRVDNPTE
jgi:hypothetical protein